MIQFNYGITLFMPQVYFSLISLILQHIITKQIKQDMTILLLDFVDSTQMVELDLAKTINKPERNVFSTNEDGHHTNFKYLLLD